MRGGRSARAGAVSPEAIATERPSCRSGPGRTPSRRSGRPWSERDSIVPSCWARTETIRDRTGRLLASVWRRRFERLIEQGYEDPEERFRMEPFAELKRFYSLVDGLYQVGAFTLMTAIDRLVRLVRESGGDPSRDPAFRIQGESRRDRGFRRAVVELDRSTLPGPLRANEPLPIEVVGVADTLIGTTRDRITQEDENERPLFDPEDSSTVVDLTGYDDRHPSLVGSSGIEREFDRRLHGSIGFREENVATRTAAQDIPPIPGNPSSSRSTGTSRPECRRSSIPTTGSCVPSPGSTAGGRRASRDDRARGDAAPWCGGGAGCRDRRDARGWFRPRPWPIWIFSPGTTSSF